MALPPLTVSLSLSHSLFPATGVLISCLVPTRRERLLLHLLADFREKRGREPTEEELEEIKTR